MKAPAEKNFRRAKVRPGARKGAPIVRWLTWRLGRRALAVAIVSYAMYRATDLVVHASGLQVRHINVRGNVRLSSGDVQAIVDGLKGASILTADLVGYRKRLMESPWVAAAELRRVLPSTVEVFVSERRPMGLCRLGSVVYLVDPHGTLIDEFGPQYSEFDLPIIDGLDRGAGPGRPTIDEARAELAARVIDALSARKALVEKVSEIDVSDAHDAVVLLQNDTALLHLGEEKFLERVQSYVDLAPALKQRVPQIDYVDLRFDARVYVRPAKK